MRRFDVMRRITIAAALILAAGNAWAEEEPQEAAPKSESAEAAPAEAEAAPAETEAAPAETEAVEQESAAAEPSLVRLDIYPPDITLHTAADRQKMVIVATRSDDVTMDVTAEASIAVGNDSLLRIESGVCFPGADGETELTASFGGLTAKVPVKVTAATAGRPISFRLDVMPVLMRGGCNTGSCHGAARGKDGFRLSLFGFDPAGDYFRITRELGTRRINLARPEASLFMEKAVGSVPHTGGKRFATESEYYDTLLTWLEHGAADDAGEVPKVTKLEIYPPNAVLSGEGTTQSFIARAQYADGTSRDVTSLVVFMTNNENSAAIDSGGLVTAGARGEAFVMARFDTHTEGSQVIVLPADLNYTPPEEPPVNYVDELVNAKLQKLRILPSEICSDEVFLRRATLDITGLLPTEDEYHAYMSDEDPEKRAKLVDALLEKKEFSEIWAMKWAELLMIRTSNIVAYKPVFLYSNWLTDQISNDVPLDQMIRELLSAKGGTFTNPPTNYYEIERSTLKVAENVAQVFMGIRTQCAQCHNHPFDRWTMDDYYSFAAFFSQIGRKTGEDYRETIIFNSGSGEVKHLVGGRVMPPKFLGGETPDVKGKDRREVLAAWLASPENPYFATSVANRVWSHFFGVGIVEPVDDIRISNPASNPELFETLGGKFTEYGYDFKQLVRDICNSQTYQRASQRNESNATDELNFAHSRLRRIKAENLLDVISTVTETKEKFRGLPVGARATQIADGRTSNYFLTTFGRSARSTVCSCDVKTEPTLSQALHLINGGSVHAKIGQGGVVKQMLDEEKAPAEAVRSLYVRCLSRQPTADEESKLVAMVDGAENKQAALEDIFWALLNSREFIFNH